MTDEERPSVSKPNEDGLVFINATAQLKDGTDKDLVERETRDLVQEIRDRASRRGIILRTDTTVTARKCRHGHVHIHAVAAGILADA